MDEWGWKDEAIPTYLKTQVYWRDLDQAAGQRVLVPIFRLPTLIHTRSGNAKYLYEISHGHPLWMNPIDAERSASSHGQMVRVNTDNGYFRDAGVAHRRYPPGRGRRQPSHGPLASRDDEAGNERWSSALVDIDNLGDGSGACARRRASSRSRPTIPTRNASGGKTPACTRTWRSRHMPIRFRACTPGIRSCRIEASRCGRSVRRCGG